MEDLTPGVLAASDAATLPGTREPLFPQRAVPPGRDRAARVPGEPDADSEAGQPGQAHVLGADHAGQAGERQRGQFQPEPPVDQRHARLGAEGEGQLPDGAVADPVPEHPREEQRQVRLQGHGNLDVGGTPHRAAPDPAPDRLLDLPDEPGSGWRLEGDELREEPCQTDVARLAEGHLQGRRRRGRSGGGAARDQGVPREPEEVPGARSPDSEGRPALRASRYRQDAARAGNRRRGRRAVLLHLGLGLRRDVRRRRRLPGARPLRAGEAGEPVHHLHRRDRRRRPPPWRRHGRWARRARADAEPAPRRDGRVRAQGQRDPDRGHEPPRHPGSGPAPPRPLRPPDRGRSSRP